MIKKVKSYNWNKATARFHIGVMLVSFVSFASYIVHGYNTLIPFTWLPYCVPAVSFAGLLLNIFYPGVNPVSFNIQQSAADDATAPATGGSTHDTTSSTQ